MEIVIPIKRGRRYYYLLPHKAKGVDLVDSIRRCLEQLPATVHEYKSLKDFLTEERAKPKFTDRELRRVKQDIRQWSAEGRGPTVVKETRGEYVA